MAFESSRNGRASSGGTAPFEEVADTIADVHDAWSTRCEPARGKRWLDVACGTGDVAELAARRRRDVVGIDFAPPLIETAKRAAAEHGLDIDYRVGDAENLEASTTRASTSSRSTFGVMFAPDQEAAAGELARVTRPGGRLGLANWTPDGRGRRGCSG